MLNRLLEPFLERHFPQISSWECKPIQSVWSGYGQLIRCVSEELSLVVKLIDPPEASNHPRGWNTQTSHLRKLKSYQVELNWYQRWAVPCTRDCRMAKLLAFEKTENGLMMALEDLNHSGFPLRVDAPRLDQIKTCLTWLAHFHAAFLDANKTDVSSQLWQTGSYWHLATRQDEHAAMNDGALKQYAENIDQALNAAQYQTVIHGDAKLANFCFSEKNIDVAAVDFQYVGGGIGVKDVMVLMSSGLTENECVQFEEELLACYFHQLNKAIDQKVAAGMVFYKKLNAVELEKEWRELYPLVWADYVRFLQGWSPQHNRLNRFSQQKVNESLEWIKAQTK